MWLLPAGMLAPVAVKLLPPEVPLTLPQLALPLAVQVGVPVRVIPAGRLSATLTLVALLGPPLPTTTT